jgi:hypothetical protein
VHEVEVKVDIEPASPIKPSIPESCIGFGKTRPQHSNLEGGAKSQGDDDVPGSHKDV